MSRRGDVSFTTSLWLLATTGLAIGLFGLVTTLWPGGDNRSYVQAVGVASVGMGLFGVMITLTAYRRRERWAWFTLWYYPMFWLAHLIAGLPRGTEHVHQIVFTVYSIAGLVVPMNAFFGGQSAATADHDQAM